MARGRMLSKKIAWDSTVNSLDSIESILAYIMTIPHLDRDGRILANGAYIKGKCLPLMEQITSEDVDEYITEWAEKGLVVLYRYKRQNTAMQFSGFKKINKMINEDGDPTALYGREAKSDYEAPSPENIIINKTNAIPDFGQEPRRVYVMQAGSLYKIGISRRPLNRLSNTKAPNDSKVKLVFDYVPIHRKSIQEEGFLHEKFGDKLHSGEWFHLAPEDIKYILERPAINGGTSMHEIHAMHAMSELQAEEKLSKEKVQEDVVPADEPASFEAEIRQTRRQSAAKPLDTHTCFTLVRDWVAENRTHLLLPVGEDISAAQLYQIPSKDRGIVKQLSKMLKANQVVAAMQHAQGMNGFKYGIFSPYLLKCVRNFVETILTEEQSHG